MSFRALCATGHEKNDWKITLLTSWRELLSTESIVMMHLIDKVNAL